MKCSVSAAVSAEVMLAITLTLLGEAGYLDFFWPYAIAIPAVYSVFHTMLEVLNRAFKTEISTV